MLTLGRVARAGRAEDNQIVIVLPDGRLVRVWATTTERNGLRLSIDAPRDVVVRRGGLHHQLSGAGGPPARADRGEVPRDVADGPTPA